MITRRQRAKTLLIKHRGEFDYGYLGEGRSSIVFHDGALVYKVHLPHDYSADYFDRFKMSMQNFLDDQTGVTDYFLPVRSITELPAIGFITTYDYFPSTPCTILTREEVKGFLVACWRRKFIFQDLKPANFIRVDNQLKWVDYESTPYTDNLFLNMVARAFVYVKYTKLPKDAVQKLRRSAVNQFNLPELSGLQDFCNEVFNAITFAESEVKEIPMSSPGRREINAVSEINTSGDYAIPYDDSHNPEKWYWALGSRNLHLSHLTSSQVELLQSGYHAPGAIFFKVEELRKPSRPVSLIIKTCVQDTETLRESVKHIVRQLRMPCRFDEIVLALDTREGNFLRAYSSSGSWEGLVREAQALVDELVIGRYIFPTPEDIRSTNLKWFGQDTETSHSVEGVPVTAQLFAFDQAKNDNVLQVDCDAMIGRLDVKHDYLEDMLTVLDRAENVLSVGFNIFQGKHPQFTPYFGFEGGGFVPEVRCCLLRRSRLEKLLPLPNDITYGGFTLTWYRTLEKVQKVTGCCSVRGGDNRSFYIHPQNFRKTSKDVWFTLVSRVERVAIPSIQQGKWELEGSYAEWTGRPRTEELVVVTCFRNLILSRFLRYWHSLVSQTHREWGLVLIDDASDNGLFHFIGPLIAKYTDRITFVRHRFQMGIGHNTHKAIHHFIGNPESIVCVVDGDDALLGKDALRNLHDKYRLDGADVVIGKMYRTDKLRAHDAYPVDFYNPRNRGGNVWQHLRSFRKYLYDSLDFRDLKITLGHRQTSDLLLSKRFSSRMKFPEHCVDYSYMVPIVELSKNPMKLDHFNVIHDRTTVKTPELTELKENTIAAILKKPAKTPADVVLGRRTFLPNLQKIEIDLTYECNLKCINCNRSSTQAPTKGGMPYAHLERFVQESIELEKHWELINLLGGEPTLHQDFARIIRLILFEYILPFSPTTVLQVTSNGFGPVVKARLAALPRHPNLIVDYASFKDDRVVPYFSPFNQAPIDNDAADHDQYHKGCWVTSYCGIGLNQLGYYPCGVAGGIDRVMGKHLGVQSLYEVDASIADLLNTFCRYCGNFTDYASSGGNFIPRNEKAALTRPQVSPTWQKIYRAYNEK